MTTKANSKPKEEPGAAGTAPDPKQTELQKLEPTYSQRFSEKVMAEFSGAVGAIELSSYQKRLIQNYFIAVDLSLKAAEDKRLKKAENYRDQVPVSWNNVNMESLALNVVACAKIGYDPALPNHINMVPYKNNKTGKYDIGFIEGYRGRELKAKKYGYDVPTHVIVELVYSGDKFVPIKKDKDNPIETYTFKVSDNPFERGTIAGGFYYHIFDEEPEKNKLMFFNVDEIVKRKPEYASVEFWGGEKAKYEKDETGHSKKVGTEKVDGYFAEMCWKTIYHMAYRAITIDSEKIDDNLQRLIENEKILESNRDPQHLENLREASVQQNGNRKNLDFTDVNFEETNKGNPPSQHPADNGEEPPSSLADLGSEKVNASGPGY